jgi:hypothetical protein
MLGLLGSLGRACGYRGIYPGYCHRNGRTAPIPMCSRSLGWHHRTE